MRERIPAFNFIRAACAIGIIFNHFTIDSQNAMERIFDKYPNGGGSVGYSIVTVFFIISGALLYYNHQGELSAKEFYRKRWKTIFPLFYFTYIAIFVGCIFVRRSFFEDKQWPLLIFTLLGMDGYAGAQFDTWYLIGEWFLGAIILLYILYPLLSFLAKKYEKFTSVLLALLFLLFLNWRMLSQNEFRNLFSCMFSFWLGIMIEKHKLYERKSLWIGSAVVSVVLCLLPIAINFNLQCHLVGTAWFFLLFAVGQRVMKNGRCAAVFNRVGRASYEIFLVHHVIIYFILGKCNPQNTVLSCAEMLAVALFIYAMAELMLKCYQIFVKRTAFDKFRRKDTV